MFTLIAKACASIDSASILLPSFWFADPRTFSIGRPSFFATPLTGRPEVRKFLRDSVAVRCATPLTLAPLRIRAVCGWSPAKGVLLWLVQCLRNVVLRRRPLGALRLPAHTTRPMRRPLPRINPWVLPRCTIKAEKCKGGMKLICSCEDEVACGTLQNLCRALCDGMCSLTCTYNGIPCCEFNLFCGMCKCEYTKDGCTITCLSGDKACCDMIQACCDCMAHCLAAGCCCYLSFRQHAASAAATASSVACRLAKIATRMLPGSVSSSRAFIRAAHRRRAA